MDVILADEIGLIGFVDRALQRFALGDEFAAHINVTGARPHGEGGDESALDQRMRVVAHDLAILAGAGLGFVGVDDEIMRPRRIDLLGHERPFQTGRKARAAASAQTRRLHLVDDLVAALVEQGLGVVPLAALSRARQRTVAKAVEIGEDAICVGEHSSSRHSWILVTSRRRHRGTSGSLTCLPARNCCARPASRFSPGGRRRDRRAASRSFPASGLRKNRR